MIALLTSIFVAGVVAAQPDAPPVVPPPEPFFEKVRERDRDVARQFYKKSIDLDGL